ncbi:hypothetical protein ISS42_01835 [Candidatus Shapirobacteria bacterium]|nr:hypothetical protein [Candidatus Shapirobacteria bacterium]
MKLFISSFTTRRIKASFVGSWPEKYAPKRLQPMLKVYLKQLDKEKGQRFDLQANPYCGQL